MEEKTKIILSAIVGFFASLASVYGAILILLIIILVFDFITGILKAKVTGEELTSGKSKTGLFKKAAELMCFVLGIFLDYFIPIMLSTGLNYQLNFNLPFGIIMAVYVIITEFISCVENLDAAGAKIPSFIMIMLNKSKKTIDEGPQGGV